MQLIGILKMLRPMFDSRLDKFCRTRKGRTVPSSRNNSSKLSRIEVSTADPEKDLDPFYDPDPQFLRMRIRIPISGVYILLFKSVTFKS